MMYAFGDDDPTQESLQVMDEILQDYIIQLCRSAQHAAGPRKVKVDDFKFSLRRDAKKLGRCEELLALQKEIAQAKKLFDENEK